MISAKTKGFTQCHVGGGLNTRLILTNETIQENWLIWV